MNWTCPVCFYDLLPYPPENYNICVCCGTEFGNDDAGATHEELLDNWIDRGAFWFYENPPAGWSPWPQLIAAGRAAQVERVQQGLFDMPIGADLMLYNSYPESNAIQNLARAATQSMIA